VPKAANVIGQVTNDIANTFDPNSPLFGEKFTPSWMPISFRDWTGREIVRTYADEFGKYNILLPSTQSVNLPMPSGLSPNMLTSCINDPGWTRNPNFNAVDPNSPPFLSDEFFDPKHTQTCLTFMYNPGATTYLDTPVLPNAAFSGGNLLPLDCEQPDATPLVYSVNGPSGGAYALRNQNITITSMGTQSVPNPLFGNPGEPKEILRDYGFGNNRGTVTLGAIPLTIVSWSNSSIVARIPSTFPTNTARQLTVTRSGGARTPFAVTMTVGPLGAGRTVRTVIPSSVPGATPIQDAIDAANPRDLILVQPGAYDEFPVMWKPVQIQGSGPFSTVLNGSPVPTEKVQIRQDKIKFLLDNNLIDPVIGQDLLDPLANEQGAGITVLAKSTGFVASPNARIDGLTVMGTTTGGGILVNGYANDLEISNNRLTGNMGSFGGGIRVGLQGLRTNPPTYPDANNDRLKIHHNHIAQNSSLGGSGGGVSLYTGTDDYTVSDNFICGNFSKGHGGGIGHQGLSKRGTISRNTIVFNQSFNQAINVNGGGISISGSPGVAGALTAGAGAVTVTGNYLHGNQAATGDGGGISTMLVNGQDVRNAPNAVTSWNNLAITDNVIVNNMAGNAGGGIAMQDTARVSIANNTVANNDSTATVGGAFLPANPNVSTPQPAGIVARDHTAGLTNAIGTGVAALYRRGFSNPYSFTSNIIWHNRSFYFENGVGLVPAVPLYNDLAVLPATLGRMDPRNSILTNVTGYHVSNFAKNPVFASQVIYTPETATAFDEGGNFIDVRFSPLTLAGNYRWGYTPPPFLAGAPNCTRLYQNGATGQCR
jgi:hypothetical protein